jgi:PST family polysaccharide transporter
MLAQSLCLFVTVIVDFGFSLSGTREIALYRDNKTKMSQIFIAIMFIKSALIIVAFFLLFVVVMAFERFSVDYEVYFLSFGIVIGQAIFPVWFFQGIEKMKFITIVNLLAKVIFTILVIVFVKSSIDYKQVPIYNSLGFIISGLLGFIVSVRYISFVPPPFKLIYQLLKETSPLFVANFATMLYTASNVLILGIFSNNALVGIYSSMEKLILAIKNIYTPIYQALFPWLSQQLDQKKIEVIKKIRPFVLGLGILISLIIVLFAKQILEILYDDILITEYSLVLKILSFVAIFSGLNMLYVGLYFPAIKNYKLKMGIQASGGILNITLALIFVNLFDIYGISISVLLTELFLLIIGFYYFNKLVKN